MRTDKDENPTTRQRLLESACDLFAAKGFTKATNKEICDRAGANIAAVNYYFGSKQNLYGGAWRKAFQDSLEAHPPDGGCHRMLFRRSVCGDASERLFTGSRTRTTSRF